LRSLLTSSPRPVIASTTRLLLHPF
jgi:hypothetical protein